ncbi:ABC transporter ATP-binding protein [Planctomicrobium sp. SH668]|uniref:ABC transporter ATP-binding protein n=1 Tax=Planctomicrobium sp. SH668 TaxID=3448126 RepID=UPI003F5C9BD7
MSKTVLEIRNLSKLYRLGEIGTGTLSHDLNRWWAKVRGKEDPHAPIGQTNYRDQSSKSNFVWALKDVNLDVYEGEILGIIGTNGAGKSTLLKLISRITAPTTGRIRIQGRIASLLEVGTGMHPEMTARENIFLNGAVLGMRRHEIARHLDDIIDFAGCRMYVDTPVKRFSSGMRVRLGFAVAAFLEPEILIVDEVLAVGDAAFQRKCLERMEDLSTNSGRTIIMVSHNSTAMASLCHRGVLIENGHVTSIGPIHQVIQTYKNSGGSSVTHWHGPSGNDEVQLQEVWVRPSGGRDVWDAGLELEVGGILDIYKPTDGLAFGFRLLSDYGGELALSLFDDAETGVAETIQPCRLTQRWRIPAQTLSSGRYRIAFTVHRMNDKPIHRLPLGELVFELENFTGLGRRYPIENKRGFDSLFRPAWGAERELAALPVSEE